MIERDKWSYRAETFYTIFELADFLNRKNIPQDWIINIGYDPHANDGKCYNVLYYRYG